MLSRGMLLERLSDILFVHSRTGFRRQGAPRGPWARSGRHFDSGSHGYFSEG